MYYSTTVTYTGSFLTRFAHFSLLTLISNHLQLVNMVEKDFEVILLVSKEDRSNFNNPELENIPDISVTVVVSNPVRSREVKDLQYEKTSVIVLRFSPFTL